MAVKQRSIPISKWIIGILLVIFVADVVSAKVEFQPKSNLVVKWVEGGIRQRRSPKWSVGSSSKKGTSTPVRANSAPVRANSAPVRATSAPVRATSAPVRATHAPVRATHAPVHATHAPIRATTHSPPILRATTAAYYPRATTSGPISRATTQGPIYPHQKPTTTARPFYPTQVYPGPIYPVFPNPPPIYIPPPPPVPQNPTVIIIRDSNPKPPHSSIIIGGSFSSSVSRSVTSKPTTTTTTTTRRPKTTTEVPWVGVEGGYDRKSWIDFVKNTQRKDIPLSGQWVRIRGGKSMREGYVEILGEGGLWGSVCDVAGRWDLHKANIVCHQLGYRGGAEAAWQGRPIDGTTVQPSHVREVNCGPTAGTLLNCNLRRSKEGYPSEIDVDGTCYNRTRNVGVRCRPEPNTVCKFGEKAFGKSCYRMVLPPSYGSKKDFATRGAEAVKTCRSGVARSELVSVTTQAENDFLSDWLQTEYPSVGTVLTSGIGTHSHLNGAKKPLFEWWLWSGKYRDIDYENWWPGWTSKPTITPIVPPKSMMCIVLQNKFPESSRTSDYFYWKAYNGTTGTAALPFICERPADDVGCLTPNQEYNGPANISESGRACLNWNLQEVRNSPIMSGLFLVVPAAVHAATFTGGNACRRLTLDKEPWCFVSPGPGQQPVPEQCLIPTCGQTSAITSYYEAPKKTNDYAPNFNQIPALVAQTVLPRSETITYSLAGLSYSGYEASKTLTETRTVIQEQPDLVASDRKVIRMKPKSPIDDDVRTVPLMMTNLLPLHVHEILAEPNNTIGEHRHLAESILEETSTLQVLSITSSPLASNETVSVDPSRPPDTVSDLSEELGTILRRKKMKAKPISAVGISTKIDESSQVETADSSTGTPGVTTEALPPVECDLDPQDLSNDATNSTEQRCTGISRVTYPPVPTPPALYYPHPENEIVMETAKSTVTQKPSLYRSHSIETRYAAGKGRPFERQLSSSDIILLLNGILGAEEAATNGHDEHQTEDDQNVTKEEVSDVAQTTDVGQTEPATEATDARQTETTDAGQTETTTEATDARQTETATEATDAGQTETTTEATDARQTETATEATDAGQTETMVVSTGTTENPTASTSLLETTTSGEQNNEVLTEVTILPPNTTVVTDPSTVLA